MFEVKKANLKRIVLTVVECVYALEAEYCSVQGPMLIMLSADPWVVWGLQRGSTHRVAATLMAYGKDKDKRGRGLRSRMRVGTGDKILSLS